MAQGGNEVMEYGEGRVRVEERGAVALLTLNRPEALNALDRLSLEALEQAVQALQDGPAARAESPIRALVLTGEGKAFAAGADIAQMQEMSPGEAEAFSLLGHRAFSRLEELPIPTLAAVNGFALGGGCELALACDWIYASSRARFGQPEVGLGLIPGFGGTSRLVRQVGIAWAKELVLTGTAVSAEEAREIGLVNRIFEPEELLPAALEAGDRIAAQGPVAVRIAKRVIQQGQDADVRTAHALEQSAFGLVFASEDRGEGVAAFLAKRTADFKGK